MNQPLHLEVLPDEQRELFNVIAKQDWINSFYLAGGTSLALRIGHRRSIDFDFFIQEDFEIREIIGYLRKLGSFELFDEAENTINGFLNHVQISFFKYEHPLLRETYQYENLRIADIFDVALMKLEAISGRGNRKDFIDLFFLADFFSFSELFKGYSTKFGIEISNHYHLLKSLVYFEDAENQPMPRMLKHVEWAEVKESIIQKVKQIKFVPS
jgi:hypothetical protein